MKEIIAFFMSILAFFASLFGINIGGGSTETTENGVVFVKNVAYGSGERELMDIAFPEGATGDVDVVLDVHGGAWTSGSKDSEAGMIRSVAAYGYVGAAISYTYISQDSHCDTILDEITLALKTVKSEAEKRGIQIHKYLIMGYSAGGHLAALYAYARGGESGLTPAAVYDKSGPTALEYLPEMKEMITANDIGDAQTVCTLLSWLSGVTVTQDNLEDTVVKQALQSVSATHYADNAVPTLMEHGQKDTIVPYTNSVILSDILTQKGITNDLVTLPNSNHDLASDPQLSQYAGDLLVQYAARYLACSK